MQDSIGFMDKIYTLINKRHIKKVYFANSLTQPPVLSYLVNFSRLSIVLQGCYEIEIEQNGQPVTLNLTEGEVVFAPPNCWDKPTWRKAGQVAMFLFGKKLTGISLITADGTSESSIKVQKIPISRPISGPTLKILQTILDFNATSDSYIAYPQLIEALIFSCLDMLKEKNKNDAGLRKAHFLFDDICSYMQQNFQYEITRNSVAGEFKITPNHLSRLFRKEGLMRFCDYLTYVRIDRAKFMLCKYDMNLSEIAGRCGFSDIAYFCRIFKKIVNKTPTQYRQLYRGICVRRQQK